MHLEDYVRPDLHWSSWHPSAPTHPAALYNVRHGYAEFGLSDLRNARMLAERVEHYAEKSWCQGYELNGLCAALEEAIGIRVRVLIACPHRDSKVAQFSSRTRDRFMETLSRARPHVAIDDAGNRAMLPHVQARLRRTLQRRG